ncbi:MAG: DNA replication and repair protein RecF [Victivallales bacterium]|nr:DNA replication and repair protein RecF [Victivallales bacterium]
MIHDISLKNFRNFERLDACFSRKINVFAGANGQGKTNLLEAIYFLGLLRSFRTSSLADLGRIGTEGFFLSATLDTGKGWKHLLEIDYSDKRRLRIDAAPVHKASHFICQFKLVAFTPGDIMLVTQNASVRRRFINMLLSSADPIYLAALNSYSDALKMRNTLLRETFDLGSMLAFEKILAENGALITNKRREILTELTPEMLRIFRSIRNDVKSFALKYAPFNGSEDAGSYLAKLSDTRARDVSKGYTTIGPHTDDFDFVLNGRSLRHFGSNGFCRLASLCLKMASVSVIAQKGDEGSKVITLVDDVTGDLDSAATDAFFETIDKSEQVFFTFTEVPGNGFFDCAEIFHIADGHIATH